MNSLGERILAHLLETERLFREVAALIGTAEAEMAKAGWKNAAVDSTTWAYDSKSVSSPRKWMPAEAFRFFKRDGSLLAFVAVLLRDSDDQLVRFAEPLVTAGCFVCERLPKIDKDLYWQSRWHAYSQARSDDGTWLTTRRQDRPAQEVVKHGYDWIEVHTFALPLVNIVDGEMLQNQVVSRLLEKLESLRSVSAAS